ncbi:MAG: preprotein translocase subunit YajC [Actinomycetota bacterium]|nr:preprotein translocase subunit YajC [Actinomycetota bacterium]
MTTSALVIAAKSQNPLGSIILFLPLIVLFYVMLIRPQKARQRQQVELMKALGVGDEVETIAGIFGTVTRADDDFIWLDISPGTTVKMSRTAVRRKVYADTDDETPSET